MKTYYSNMTITDPTGEDFHRCVFTNCKVTGNLTETIFAKTKFINSTFICATAYEAVFEECTFVETTFDRTVSRNIAVSKSKFTNCDFILCTFNEGRFTEVELNDDRQNITPPYCSEGFFEQNFVAKTSSWERCTFNGLDLRNSNFTGASFIGCTVKGSDLFHAHLGHTNLRYVKIKDSNLTRTTWKGATLFETLIERSPLVDSRMNNTNFRSGAIMGCDLTDLMMTNANLHEVNLSGSTPFYNPWEWLTENFQWDKNLGGFIVYKAVGRTFFQRPESWVLEPGAKWEETVNPSPTVLNSSGVNFGTYDWCSKVFPKAAVYRFLLPIEALPTTIVPLGEGKTARTGLLIFLGTEENKIPRTGLSIFRGTVEDRKETEYNGWANYQTWCLVSEILDNRGWLDFLKSEIIPFEDNLFKAGEKLKALILAKTNSMAFMGVRVFESILRDSLEQMDWERIAKAVLEQ